MAVADGCKVIWRELTIRAVRNSRKDWIRIIAPEIEAVLSVREGDRIGTGVQNIVT